MSLTFDLLTSKYHNYVHLLLGLVCTKCDLPVTYCFGVISGAQDRRTDEQEATFNAPPHKPGQSERIFVRL